MVCAFLTTGLFSFAQLSTRENYELNYKLGARPRAGDAALQFVIPIINLSNDSSAGFYEGYSATTGRVFNVESAAYLTETTGYELYSPWNFGGNDGFNIASSSTIQLDAGGDSAMVDLTEFDDLDDSSLSYVLSSLSGIKFVRNNAFNYPEATSQTAENTFTSSTPVQLVTNVAVNDILIAEYDTIQHKYAVIKITGVMDDAGVALDRYIFNLKK